MGLELGPPWLVAVIKDYGSGEVIYKDNFTGAGFERVRRVVKDEKGSFSAVLGKAGSLAHHPDGRCFDPINEMKGRNFGTPAERGHRAYLIACGLLGDAPHPFASKEANTKWLGDILKWMAFALIATLVVASIR
jgi:hypothetical protein